MQHLILLQNKHKERKKERNKEIKILPSENKTSGEGDTTERGLS